MSGITLIKIDIKKIDVKLLQNLLNQKRNLKKKKNPIKKIHI